MSSAVASPMQHPAQPYSDPYSDPASIHAQDPAPSSPSTRISTSFQLANGAPPNTPASPFYSNPSTAMNTPRAKDTSASLLATPTSASSVIKHDASFYSATKEPTSSPYSDRQDSARTSAPYNTPELAAGGFDLERDRSREDAGSTPGAGPQKKPDTKADKRIFSEPPPASVRAMVEQKQPVHTRSAGQLAQPQMTKIPVDDNTIISRLVIADPQEDLERERARIAQSQAVAPPMDTVAGLGLTSSDAIPAPVPPPAAPPPQTQQRSRQEHLKNAQPRRETRFVDYILGQTIGEGEFGKVKLGWKKDGGIQVAIKLIRKDSLGDNPSRLAKVYREVEILRGLQHPNIVRLHEMADTPALIGIVLEYASGGELFDYILNHRYLKDHAARRLFAQLISGVGYLHRQGIVHRDLKLENLLLDRNKNIIITDFGFANTFDAADELDEEIEYNLSNKDYVKSRGLDQRRRGDLMQTSCGSPCYAAPELVVSDSLYTGRKVDVWSCGVILYAMLAGYLPFDDDPANPEGDNINLLYKYIVSTPLTFPEYVTPHARDLLRRILVPDPRKRADLFEVARHSWLGEYASVVAFITSTPAVPAIVKPVNVPSDDYEPSIVSGLGRSASVREPTKSSPRVGGSTMSSPDERSKRERDAAKRMTLQVEYVAPQTATMRETPAKQQSAQPSPVSAISSSSKPRSRAESTPRTTESILSASLPPASSSTQRPISMAQPPRSTRPMDIPRAVSDTTALAGSLPTSVSGRPSTRGSISGPSRLPSRGNSYGQPAAATVAPTNVEGRFSQPQRNSLILSGPVLADVDQDSQASEPERPVSQYVPTYPTGPSAEARRHKRTSTVESITQRFFGRTPSTRRQSTLDPTANRSKRDSRTYPPVSMPSPSPDYDRRQSTSSRRSSFRRESAPDDKRQSKRFSFLPTAWSRMSLSKDPSEAAENKENKRQSSVMGPPPSRSNRESKVLSAIGPSPTDRPRTMPAPAGPQRGITSPELGWSSARPSTGRAVESPTLAPQAPEVRREGRESLGGKGNTLQKPHRRLGEEAGGGGARRVMNWFRSRGRERGG